MKLYLRSITLTFLCLLFQQTQAIESIDKEQHIAEKGSRADSKSKLKMINPAKIGGPTGPTGAPGSSLTPAYAAAYQEDQKNLGEQAIGNIVTAPFTTMDYARGITLDPPSDTFTLPKGIYTVRFQFMLSLDSSQYNFSSVFLSICCSKLNLAWSHTSAITGQRCIVGSTIFQVSKKDTKIKLCLEVASSGGELIFVDGNTPLNYPTRIVFEKIAELA
jgi:hypothetical protein